MSSRTVVIDGYNLLLSLARREKTDLGEAQLDSARARLTELIGTWVAARDEPVAATLALGLAGAESLPVLPMGPGPRSGRCP